MYKSRIRPGASITFESLTDRGIEVGERGIATMPMKVNWGKDGELIEINKNDITTGKFSDLFGDTDTLPITLMLLGCKTVLLYTINKGVQATATIGTTLTVTAKYGGTFGNKISVGIQDEVVFVNVDGKKVDEQEVSDFDELIDNDWVTFSGTGSPTTTPATRLSGGTNGSSSNNYDDYYKKLLTKQWQVLACYDTTMNTNVKTLITRLRDEEDIKVQAVMVDNDANHEGIIKLKQQNVMYNDRKITPQELTCYVAGITAGAGMDKSNTNRLTPFNSIVDEMTNTEINDALINGFFLFTYRSNRKVKCEEDINSLTEFTSTKNEDFSKNKIIRILDQFHNDIKTSFEENFLGDRPNDKTGREEFKNSLVKYFKDRESESIIEDFDAKNDIQINQGKTKSQVYSVVSVKPIDAMEHLDMVIKLR